MDTCFLAKGIKRKENLFYRQPLPEAIHFKPQVYQPSFIFSFAHNTIWMYARGFIVLISN